jgi:tyrosyl-tRNA synthetase
MSKSLGNYIGVTEPPDAIYAKTLSISDALMWRYYALLTDLAPEAIEADQAKGAPMASKMALARRLVTDFHGAPAAEAAEAEWRRVHQQRQAPSEMAVLRLATGTHKLREVLVAGGLVRSRSEAERLVRQGAVRRDGVVVESGEISLASGETAVVSVGPARFLRIHARD